LQGLLDWMEKSRADFINTFRDLSADAPPEGERYLNLDFRDWYARWQERLGREGTPKAASAARMQAANPAIIPRNHRVEETLTAAEERDDLGPLHVLLAALSFPYEPTGDWERYRDPPDDECGYRTYCGT
jgi:uncharacterized protein YdiU (UPF0061 family)